MVSAASMFNSNMKSKFSSHQYMTPFPLVSLSPQARNNCTDTSKLTITSPRPVPNKCERIAPTSPMASLCPERPAHALPPVGLEINRVLLPEPEEGRWEGESSSSPLFFVPMYQAVPTDLYCSTVLVDADIQQLSETLDVGPAVLEESLALPEVPSDLEDEQRDPQTDGENRDSKESELIGDLGVRFADLFRTRRKVRDDVRRTAAELTVRLNALVQSGNGIKRFVPRVEELRPDSPSPGSVGASLVELPSAKKVKTDVEDEKRCGFSRKALHKDLMVLCDGFAVVKIGDGLYRSARAASSVNYPAYQTSKAKQSYFEVYVVEDCGTDGICIGVSTSALPLNKLVGSDRSSVGMHSTGSIVADNGNFEDYGEAFKAGDRIGCLARICMADRLGDLPPCSAIDSRPASLHASSVDFRTDLERTCDGVELTFYVNGKRQPTIFQPIVRQPDEKELVLYPTISLYKKESKAVLCCCPDDWRFAPDFVRHAAGACHSTCDFEKTVGSTCSA